MSIALVTGASGFVGRHFTRHLREQGWKVRALDIREGEHVAIIDALDYFRASGAENLSFDLVIHAAAVVGGRQVIDHDPLAQAANLELDSAMFRWALRARPGRVIYFSSSAAYPVYLQTPERRYSLREDDIRFDGTFSAPDQVYGWAKLSGELLARKAREYGLPVSVVRPFSGYGEDQDDCYPFPAFIDRALRREDPFTVWGSGEQVRDFIHVDDIVAAVMALYEREVNGPVNLATGIPTSMRELAGRVCAFAGYQPALETVPSAPSGVAHRVGYSGKMRQFCPPEVTLEQGIRRALEYRSRLPETARMSLPD